MDAIKVSKRDGRLENFDPEKIHRVIEWALDGYTGVSVSEIELNAQLRFSDLMSTRDIHSTLIRSASELITLDSPNYQYVAARLLLYMLRKDVWGSHEEPSFLECIQRNVDLGVYEDLVLQVYTPDEIRLCGDKIEHDRDYTFTYAGLQQMCDKYLVKDRSKAGTIYETPQTAFMMVAMTIFHKYPKEERLTYVFRAYDYISKFKLSLPTPILSGVRTPKRGYASCCLIDVDDTMGSIEASGAAAFRYTGNRSGIGINVGRIRPINASVRGGEVVHTGLIPFLKMYEATVKSCQQNGIRGGSATVNVPFWHLEIEDIMTLKNNTKTGDSSVRGLDYAIGFSRLFYQRFLRSVEEDNEDVYITLFDPHECIDLYEVFGYDNDEFERLYHLYEQDPTKTKKTVRVQDLMRLYTKERRETARIYTLNVDNVNSHSSFLEPIYQTNLCCEITQPTKPIQHIDDENGEIGVCVLAAINVLEIKSDAELKKVCEVGVRFLEELIDIQNYPVKAAENFTRKRRSLGIGITNLAALLAKNNIRYDDHGDRGPNFVDELMEKIQYNLLRASVKLAKERGPCEKFHLTKYAKGLLPIDHYNRNVDNVVTRKPTQDWEGLREQIREHGLRHSSVSAQMPCESSSVYSNSTNGGEPVKEIFSFKSSKAGKLPFLVPSAAAWKNRYTLQFDMQDNIGYINITAAMQKWIDMAISIMHYYNYEHYEDRKLPDSKLMQEMIYHYTMGGKSIYYTYSNDLDEQSKTYADVPDAPALPEMMGCESGACSL